MFTLPFFQGTPVAEYWTSVLKSFTAHSDILITDLEPYPALGYKLKPEYATLPYKCIYSELTFYEHTFAVDVKLEKLNEELQTEACEQLIKRLNDLSLSNVDERNFDWYAAELKEEITKKREV